jgi:hypothetical protein
VGYYLVGSNGEEMPMRGVMAERLPEAKAPPVLTAEYITKCTIPEDIGEASAEVDARSATEATVVTVCYGKKLVDAEDRYIALALVRKVRVERRRSRGTRVTLELVGDARRLVAPLARVALMAATGEHCEDIANDSMEGDIDGVVFEDSDALVDSVDATQRSESDPDSSEGAESHTGSPSADDPPRSSSVPPTSASPSSSSSSSSATFKFSSSSSSSSSSSTPSSRSPPSVLVECYVGGDASLGPLVGKDGCNKDALAAEVVGVLQAVFGGGRDEAERLRPVVKVDANETRTVTVMLRGTATQAVWDVVDLVRDWVAGAVKGKIELQVICPETRVRLRKPPAESRITRVGDAPSLAVARKAEVRLELDPVAAKRVAGLLIGHAGSNVKTLKDATISLIKKEAKTDAETAARLLERFEMDVNTQFAVLVVLQGAACGAASTIAAMLCTRIDETAPAKSKYPVVLKAIVSGDTTRSTAVATDASARLSTAPGPVRRAWVGAPPVSDTDGRFTVYSHAAPRGRADVSVAEASNADILCFPHSNGSSIIADIDAVCRGGEYNSTLSESPLVSMAILWKKNSFRSVPESGAFSQPLGGENTALVCVLEHLGTGAVIVPIAASTCDQRGGTTAATNGLADIMMKVAPRSKASFVAVVKLGVGSSSSSPLYECMLNALAVGSARPVDTHAADRSSQGGGRRVSDVSAVGVPDETDFVLASPGIECLGHLALPRESHFSRETGNGRIPNDFHTSSSLPLFVALAIKGHRSSR